MITTKSGERAEAFYGFIGDYSVPHILGGDVDYFVVGLIVLLC